MSNDYDSKIPKHWGHFYIFTFLKIAVAFTILMPLLMHVVGPVLNFALHGTPIEVSQARAFGFEKMCSFILFTSLWTSGVLWLQKFIPWYRNQNKKDPRR